MLKRIITARRTKRRVCRSCGNSGTIAGGTFRGGTLCIYCQREDIRVRLVQLKQVVRKQVFDHYGWKCVCCGERHEEFLTIDHIGGKPFPENSFQAYLRIVRENYPDTFRTLCMNCNWSLGVRGYCPHTHRLDI